MNTYDMIIIGAGPAGLTAGIYTLRAGLKALILESSSIMSQAGYAAVVENFPGFPDGISGAELLNRQKTQARNLGAEIISSHVNKIVPIKGSDTESWAITADKKSYQALSIIIASGASAKKLDIKGESRFVGRGVSYCAICDGAFFKGKTIAVIGGGDSALEEALFLTSFAKKVYIIHRRDRLRAVKFLQDKAVSNPKIEVLWSSVADEIFGDKSVSGMVISSKDTGKSDSISCEGIFISIGKTPNTDFLKGIIDLDKQNYIKTDRSLAASKPGIFACGDCRNTFFRQIITACGDGALAAYSYQKYIEQLKGTAYK